MKNGKLLTRKEKVLLKNEGFNPKEWLRIKKAAEYLEFVHRTNGKILTLRV